MGRSVVLWKVTSGGSGSLLIHGCRKRRGKGGEFGHAEGVGRTDLWDMKG